MAKKKGIALTSEERLQAALVPDWEQPYKVPKNWCWVRGEACFMPMESTKPVGETFFYIDIDAIDNKRQQIMQPKELLVSKAPSRASRKIYKGSTLFSLVRPYLKNIAYIESSFENCIASTGFYVCTPNQFLKPRYTYYLMTSSYVVEGLNKYMKGDNSPSIRGENIEKYPFPIPPVDEQQRIVDRIESLFAQLDEAKEKAQAVVDSFETRKAAILSSAFRGEYTKKWRAQHGVPDTDWKTIRFDQAADIKSNLVDPAEYGDYPHIAPDNIEKKTGVLLDYNTISEDKVTSGKHRFYPGQILYSKIRPYLSKVVVVDFNGLCSADMYPIKAKENTRFLWYYMLSDEFLLQASSSGSRSVLPKINQKELSALSVRMTNRDEQEEVVRILDDIFPKEQQAKESAEAVLAQIDTIKKSILARAFRGELGTNEPTEGSAEELVKRVLLDKIPKDTPKRKRAKKHPEVEFVAKTIMQTLAAGAKITPEKLKAETGLQIDDFYDQLKALIDSGHVIETRIDGESYLEAKDEDRQPNN